MEILHWNYSLGNELSMGYQWSATVWRKGSESNTVRFREMGE